MLTNHNLELSVGEGHLLVEVDESSSIELTQETRKTHNDSSAQWTCGSLYFVEPKSGTRKRIVSEQDLGDLLVFADRILTVLNEVERGGICDMTDLVKCGEWGAVLAGYYRAYFNDEPTPISEDQYKAMAKCQVASSANSWVGLYRHGSNVVLEVFHIRRMDDAPDEVSCWWQPINGGGTKRTVEHWRKSLVELVSVKAA